MCGNVRLVCVALISEALFNLLREQYEPPEQRIFFQKKKKKILAVWNNVGGGARIVY